MALIFGYFDQPFLFEICKFPVLLSHDKLLLWCGATARWFKAAMLSLYHFLVWCTSKRPPDRDGLLSKSIWSSGCCYNNAYIKH